MSDLISPLHLRQDGRKLLQHRHLDIRLERLTDDFSSFNPADAGAALYIQGATRILAQVIDCSTTRLNKQMNQNHQLAVDIAWAPFAGAERRPRRNERLSASYAQTVQSACEGVLITTRSKGKIFVQLTILGADGAILSSCINATVMALMRAGIALTDIPCAVTAAFLENQVIIDPSANEASAAEAELTLTIVERSKQISVMICESRIDTTALDQLMNAGTSAAVSVAQKMRSTMKAHLEKSAIAAYVLSVKTMELCGVPEHGTKHNQEV